LAVKQNKVILYKTCGGVKVFQELRLFGGIVAHSSFPKLRISKLLKKIPFHAGMSKDLVLLKQAELKVATSSRRKKPLRSGGRGKSEISAGA
jgi:hypothetical protein